MIEAKKVKVGFAPTRRTVFDKVEAKRYKDLIEARLKEWRVDYVNLDFLNEEGLLFNIADAEKAAERFAAEKVDAVFVPHCNFGTEDATAKLCKLAGKPVLLWGPRDEGPDKEGKRKRDTQCGLFATSKSLRRFGVPFTYLPNSWGDGPEFEHGLKAFLKVVAAQKAVLGARIGQLSTRPKPFWSVIVNEGELLERFGIEIVPTTVAAAGRGVQEIVDADDEELRALVADMRSRIEFPNQEDAAVSRHAALVLWQRRWAEREGLDAIAVQCWADLIGQLGGVWACFANSEVTGGGIPVGCETDILAALTGLMLQAAAGSPTFCADLTIRHPKDDNAELLWHCGPFPSCLAADDSKKEVVGYQPDNKVSGLGQWRIKGGPLTIGRIDGDNGEYSMFMGHTEGTDGPFTRGTYLWIKADDWLEWEEKLMYGPYIHHVVGVHGHVAPVLYEACKYIPGLKADPVELDEQAMRRFWRGADR